MDKSTLCGFIRQQRYGVVSSAANDGSPQSALVGIASTSRLEIVFDTMKSSRKYQNLMQRPACSLVIGWSGEQTLQLDGIAEEPKGADLRRLQDVYFAQWPECREHTSWPGIAYFVVRPHWIRYSDYDQKPPLIQEIEKTPYRTIFDASGTRTWLVGTISAPEHDRRPSLRCAACGPLSNRGGTPDQECPAVPA